MATIVYAVALFQRKQSVLEQKANRELGEEILGRRSFFQVIGLDIRHFKRLCEKAQHLLFAQAIRRDERLLETACPSATSARARPALVSSSKPRDFISVITDSISNYLQKSFSPRRSRSSRRRNQNKVLLISPCSPCSPW